MNVAAFKQENVLDAVLPWCGWMIVGAVVIAISKSIADIALGVVSENITAGMRKELYENVVRKDIGWHDNRENGAGVITSTLASDVQLLSGVSARGSAVAFEAGSAVLAALIMAFYFSWPMALCGLGVVPFIIICGAIQQKADQENMLGMEAECS